MDAVMESSDSDSEDDSSKPGGSGSCCSVARCPHYNNNPISVGVTFHTFPKDPEVRKTWAQRTKRDNWKPTSGSRICSAHFKPDDFVATTKRGTAALRPILKPGVAPTVFNCLPENVRPAGTTTTPRRGPPERHHAPEPPAPKRQKQACQTDLSYLGEDEYKLQIAQLHQRVAELTKLCERQTDEIGRLQAVAAHADRKNELLSREHSAKVVETSLEIASLETRLSKQEFRAEKFEQSDASVMQLTGLPSYAVLKFVFDTVMWGDNQECMDTLDIVRDKNHDSYPNRGTHGGGKNALDYRNQFFLTLVKLRTGMTEATLSAIFMISQQTVSRYYLCWIRVAEERFRKFFREWPYLTVPDLPVSLKVASLFPKVTTIIDCFEIKIEKPRNPDAARKCYSNYKKSYTVKALVGVESDGNVCFLSHVYQGAISDVAIVRESGLMEKLQVGDVVLADRGFPMASEAADKGVKRIVPPSVSKDSGMTREQLADTCAIARARILVERSIGRLKNFHQLDGPLKILDLPRIDFEIKLVSHLCRFQPLLVRDLDFQDPDFPPVQAELAPAEDDSTYDYAALLDDLYAFS